jgi:hypothetical protein
VDHFLQVLDLFSLTTKNNSHQQITEIFLKAIMECGYRYLYGDALLPLIHYGLRGYLSWDMAENCEKNFLQASFLLYSYIL